MLIAHSTSRTASHLAPAVVVPRGAPVPLARVLLRLLLALLGVLTLCASAARAADFLPVDRAFRLEPEALEDGRLLVRIAVAPGTYLYREQFKLESLTPGVQLGEPELPKGQIKHDETFDKDMEVYHADLEAKVAVTGSAAPAYLKVGYQGCADAGLCYPPQTRYLAVMLSGGKVSAITDATEADAQRGAAALAAGGAPQLAPVPADDNPIGAALRSGSLVRIAGFFVVAGLLLSFTPCVLPMVPILSSIIVGHGRPSRGRGLAMAASYSLGMAMVYTLFGVLAGLAGEGLAARLQNPWVLGTFSLLLVGLSLSMFGAYTLQLPGSWQAGISQASGRFRPGRLTGVFMMGGLSALLVGPCVAAPLAGALVYISQTRDVVIGGVALFAMAAGMSVPLLLVGVSAGSLLPRTGAWMESVKTVFGMLLLAVAWWLVQPVLPAPVALFLLGVWFALGAAFMGAFDSLGATASVLHRSLKGLGLVLALIGAAQIVGALLGATDPLRPLQPLAGRIVAAAGSAGGGDAADAGHALPFKRIASSAELDAELQRAAGRPVMLDFYADWCVSCKEMERFTFSDPAVQARLKNVVLLQADVTANNDDHRALMKRFGLFGPPGILFFDGQGRELEHARVIGFQAAAPFLQSLGAAGIL